MNMKKPAPFRRGSGSFKHHCARRWWVYVIGFAVINVSIILGVIYGIIPSIAQNAVNSAGVRADGIAITNPTVDRITLSMNSTVFARVPVAARFDNQTFEMYLPQDANKTTFMTLGVGELQAQNTMVINVTGADTKILNATVYQQFSKDVLSRSNFTLGIKSRPMLKVGAMKYPVQFDKTIQLKGFNGLKGITITNPVVLNGSNVMADGTNLLTDAVIPNPSSFTMQIGDLTTNIAIESLDLGFSVIKNLTLYPGNNPVKIFNHINAGLMALPTFSSILSQPNINITLKMNSTVFGGQHVTWLETPLRETSPFYAIMNPTSAPAVGSATAGELSVA
ncbi:hypothetical protein Dda_8271 [Drechslerella dactyloides]|uniref:Uncharacterized protein n=1 Tax=Drechslerella dactyloides TaxID=74499 RepID=A0AAD6IVX7_DREDA|nr:hypothetical protein Dda_8271 [Drechslerella dactyloides]